ncbi:MAG: alginate export family protein [Bryobacteraceae bacterium]
MSWQSGAVLLFVFQASTLLPAQSWDPLGRAADTVSADTGGKLKISFEFRGRYEIRTGAAFGRDSEVDTGLVRTRLGLTYKPTSWLKLSGMLQDSRSPWYGENAPSTVRDPTDLHEAYVELFPDAKTGFGMTAGRKMLNYGDRRLIGSPQWNNLSRTFDHARVYYRLPKVRFELLLISPVKIRLDGLNRPVLGERIWGTYNTFPNLPRKSLLDVYALRHDQNREGGFSGGARAAGTDRLAVNTFGFRLTGPLVLGLKHTMEVAAQNGKVGAAEHRALAWFAGVSRLWTAAGRPLNIGAEYTFASGTRNPDDARRSGTFDQLSPANHDKFGHEDLFGWRNLRNTRLIATCNWTKLFAVTLLYNNAWLVSSRDSLYSAAGRSIARSPNGSAGRHVGQEADLFATYRFQRFTLGAGYGYFFAGGFVVRTTPGANPHYVYLFHTYSF